MNNKIQPFEFEGASLPGDGRGTEDNIILETQRGNPTSTLPADIIEGTCNVSRTVRKTFLSLTMSDDLLTPTELAAMLGMSVRTLANWRSTGKGPPYLKIGVEPPEGHQDRRKVRYQRQIAERWALAHEYRRTVAR